MQYECINPEIQERMRLITESSDKEIEDLDFGDVGYFEMGECRLHWGCCPSCRRDFQNLPSIAERAGRGWEKWFAGELAFCRRDFLAKKNSLLESGDDLAYSGIIARLAAAENDVHESLRRALVVAQNVYRGSEIRGDIYEREILSECQEFVNSLDPEDRHFVRATTFCFELVRPLWEKVGHYPRFDPRSLEQIVDDLNARMERSKAGTEPEAEAVDLSQNLTRALMESGFEPKVLWEVIELAASAGTGGGTPTGIESLIERKFRELADDVDSIKAGQMENIRLSERSIRRAEDYGPEISARIGQPLYSRLTEMTRRLLGVAEFFYQANGQEPNHFDPPVMKMAMAYEFELKESVVVPILRELIIGGEKSYGSVDMPLIRQGQINERLTAGMVAHYLKTDDKFAGLVRALGLAPEGIRDDAYSIARYRNRAAHDLALGRGVADDLRRQVLRSDGVFSRLHPPTISK